MSEPASSRALHPGVAAGHGPFIGSTRVLGTVAMLAVSCLGVATGAYADPYPSQRQVDDAQAAAGATSSRISAIENVILAAQDDLERAQVAAQHAAEDHNEAQVRLADAAAEAERSAAEAAAASTERSVKQQEIGVLAAATYRGGAGLGSGIEAFLSGGPQDLIDRTDAVNLLSQRRQEAFKAADQAANTSLQATRRAKAAEAARARAAADAEAARTRAEQAVARADRDLDTTQRQRASLISRLAVLNRTTEELQRQRQDGLEAERAAAAEAAARKAAARAESARAAAEQAAREKAAAQRLAVQRVAAAQEASRKAAQEEAQARRAAERATRQVKDTQGADLVAEAEAARAEAEAAARAAASKAAAEKAAAEKAAAEKAAAEKAAEKAAAEKAAADRAAADREGRSEGSSSATASAGRAAVGWARTQIGKPYKWGATGPSSYDCSGLTGAAWRRAGVILPRTSRDQYRASRKISYSQLRPGDLIFYGDGSSASSIHHVTMYSGNGMMIEAPRTGLNVREVPLRMKGAMMYAGRP